MIAVFAFGESSLGRGSSPVSVDVMMLLFGRQTEVPSIGVRFFRMFWFLVIQ